MSSSGNTIRKRDYGSNEVLMSSIFSAISDIRHGSIKIYIQDGKVIQIDKLNKLRIR